MFFIVVLTSSKYQLCKLNIYLNNRFNGYEKSRKKTEDLNIDESYNSMTAHVNYFQLNVICVQNFARTKKPAFYDGG